MTPEPYFDDDEDPGPTLRNRIVRQRYCGGHVLPNGSYQSWVESELEDGTRFFTGTETDETTPFSLSLETTRKSLPPLSHPFAGKWVETAPRERNDQ